MMRLYDQEKFKFICHFKLPIEYELRAHSRKVRINLEILFTEICEKTIMQRTAVYYSLHCRHIKMKKTAQCTNLYHTCIVPQPTFVADVRQKTLILNFRNSTEKTRDAPSV